MANELAFLENGRLFFVRKDSGKPDKEEYHSQFGQEMKDRAMRIAQKNSWKNRTDGEDFLSSRQLWGGSGANGDADAEAMAVHITAIAPSEEPDEIMFALSTRVVGGLFVYNRATKKEQRLFHKEGMIISDLCRDSESGKIVCSLRNANGTAFIAMVGTSLCDQITEGDCIDESPSWVPGEENTIVYQSAGVGRNKAGFAVGLSSCAIQKLNLVTGDQEEILHSSEYDYLLPRMDKEGNLYYIRRPYQTGAKSASALTTLKDIVLFPFRLGRAFVAFLNFFSLTFTRRPLTTQDNQGAKTMDLEKVFLRGRMIDAGEAMRNSKLAPDEAPLVPSDWVLIKRSKNGDEETIADSVAAYDFDSENNLIFTNGRGTYKMAAGKKPELLFKSNLIEMVLPLS